MLNPGELSAFQNELDRFYYQSNYEEIQKNYLQFREDFIGFGEALDGDYSLINKLTIALITLPYSKAGVERTFSMSKILEGIVYQLRILKLLS